MTAELTRALDKLAATRATLRAHLLAHDGIEAASETTPKTATKRRVRILGEAIEQAWNASTLSHMLDVARPVAVQVIRENPFVALALAAGLGAVLGFSPGARTGAGRTAGKMAWKSIDAATVLGLLWEAYGQSEKSPGPAEAPAPENPD